LKNVMIFFKILRHVQFEVFPVDGSGKHLHLRRVLVRSHQTKCTLPGQITKVLPWARRAATGFGDFGIVVHHWAGDRDSGGFLERSV